MADENKPGGQQPATPPADGKPADGKPGGQSQPPADGQPKPDAGKAGADGEGKPAGADGQGKAPDPPARVVPDKYDIKVPDGSHVDVADIESLAKEHKLTNDEAQGIFEAAHAAQVARVAKWGAELKADKTYGGDNLVETERLVNLVLDKVRPKGTPRGDGIRKLVAAGVGSNLEFVSLLADIGKAMKEDSPIGGSASSGGDRKDKPIHERMYPNAKS